MRINLLLKITLVALVLLGLSLRSAVSAGGSDEEVFPPKTLEKLKKNYSAKQQEKKNSNAVKGSEKSLKPADKDQDASVADSLFGAVMSCINSVQTNEENIVFAEESYEDREAFLNSLTTNQFELITNFVNSIPKVKHSTKYKCTACGKDNELKLEGIQDFFS